LEIRHCDSGGVHLEASDGRDVAMLSQLYRVVVLKAFNAGGDLVLEAHIPNDDWYDGDQPLIDEAEARRERGIVQIDVTQFDSRGRLYQRWRTTYEENGEFLDLFELDVEPTPISAQHLQPRLEWDDPPADHGGGEPRSCPERSRTQGC